MRWMVIANDIQKAFQAANLSEAANKAFDVGGDGVYLHDAESGRLYQVIDVSDTCTDQNPSEPTLQVTKIN